MPERTLLVQISDPHLRVGERGPAAALRAAVDRIAALQPRPAAVVVTGDVANAGADEEYATATELLGLLDVPVHVIPGNHDDRAGMRAAFGQAGAPSDPIQFAFDAGSLRVIACDTSIPGRDSGSLDLAWLAARLAEAPERHTVIAMHHPPIHIGVGGLDEMGLPGAEREAFHALLARSPQVVAVVAGHVHRAATGVLTGVPVITAPGVDQQLALDFIGDTVEVNADPPGFLIHVLTDTGLVSHVQSIGAGDGGGGPSAPA